MSNLKDWILQEAKDEPVEAVVIGPVAWADYNVDVVPLFARESRGKVLTWEQAEPIINYEFNSGYGSPGCDAVYAWTKNKVIFVSQYDGSTSINNIPRNPVDCVPEMPGG